MTDQMRQQLNSLLFRSRDWLTPNHPLNAGDDLTCKRYALYGASERRLFVARVTPHATFPTFPAGSLLVFDAGREPVDGDIVAATCFTQDRPNGWLIRTWNWIRRHSFHGERLLDYLEFPKHRPEVTSLVLSVYQSEGMAQREELFCLHPLDSSGTPIRNSHVRTIYVEGVLTTLTPHVDDRGNVTASGLLRYPQRSTEAACIRL